MVLSKLRLPTGSPSEDNCSDSPIGFRSCTATVLSVGLVDVAASSVLMAGIRGPGAYNGVVFYDRWDNRYSFSGVYRMYIADTAKEALRPYRGKSMEIDFEEVHQPMNSGDGLIKRLDVIGESKCDPRPIHRTPLIREVGLKAVVSRESSGRFKAAVEIRNNSSSTVPIESGALGFALLVHDEPSVFCPSDGTSCAVSTRISATSADGENRFGSQTWGWAFDASRRLPDRFALRPGEMRTTSVFLSLKKGDDEFIAGYGGGVHAGPSAASNTVSFDVRY